MKKRLPPALVLYILAPAIGELISGSAPPVEFFNPIFFIILSALYGSGAVLVREISLRWNKRWPTIVMLGLAYAIIEEGLMVKSFFDPAWHDLGNMAFYGRWLGVNWPWTVELMIYHALVSISIPIQLVELIYPEKRNERWLARRGMIGLAVLLALDVAFGCLFLMPYRPPAGLYLLAMLATLILILWARALPAQWPARAPAEPYTYRRIILAGVAVTMGIFFGAAIFPGAGWSPLLSIVFMIVVCWLGYHLIRRASGFESWGDLGRLALIRGALLPLILFNIIREFSGNQSDNPAGMTLVGIVTLLGLWWLGHTIRERQPKPPEPEDLLPFSA